MHQSVRAQQYGPQITWRISILYTNDKAFWWQERASDDASIRSPRFAELARYIEAKTLLQPRTFDPLLMATAQLVEAKAARLARSAILFLAFYLPTVLFVGTRGVEAAIIAALAIGGLALFFWYLDALTSKTASVEVVNVGEDVDGADVQPVAADHAYEMRVSAPWFELARILGIGAGAAVSLLAAVGVIYGLLESFTASVQHIADPSMLIWPLGFFGGLAVFFIIELVRSRATIVRADATGLIQDGPIRLAYIPWNGIISVERHDDPTAAFYQVQGDVGYVVKWPLQTPKSLRFTPSKDAALAKPEDLAEIAMARSGVPITRQVHGKRASRAGGEIR